MSENEEFWDLYWEVHLQEMENLGKRTAIVNASRLIRKMSHIQQHDISILELGCGEGQIIGTLVETHFNLCKADQCVGIDYNPLSLTTCRTHYPAVKFIEGDFSNPQLVNQQGKFDLVLLVNALHEVFSAVHIPGSEEIDVTNAKQQVEKTLALAASCLKENGWLLLFDGLEPAGDPDDIVSIRFLDWESRHDFDIFAAEYKPFAIGYRPCHDPLQIELTRHDFTRYIDKSIFLQKKLWQSERFESYQYFTEDEFREAFSRQGLQIVEMEKLTVNEDKWRQRVELLTQGIDFPDEHILIIAAAPSSIIK